MNKPLLQAFFVGRAVAEVINERLEVAITDALSDLGKFDAEVREQMHQFTQEVLERAERAAEAANAGETASRGGHSSSDSVDLQATIDELRAEIALLRNELQRYRSSSV